MAGESSATAPPVMKATQEQMHAARLDMVYRDFCADLLIPLNACRRKSLWLPWKCEHERHAYERCEYVELKRRMAMAAAGEAGSPASA